MVVTEIHLRAGYSEEMYQKVKILITYARIRFQGDVSEVVTLISYTSSRRKSLNISKGTLPNVSLGTDKFRKCQNISKLHLPVTKLLIDFHWRI